MIFSPCVSPGGDSGPAAVPGDVEKSLLIQAIRYVHLARGEASVSDLVGLFSLTQPTISSHLKVLESAGLISRSRVAQSRPCKLETERLKAVTDWLEQVQEIWEGNYKQLDALLAELKQAQEEERKE